MKIKTFELFFRIENLGIELDDKRPNCVIVKFDNYVDRNKKISDGSKLENTVDKPIHNHFVCYEFNYVEFVGKNPIHDPEPIVTGENRYRLERKDPNPSQFEFALGFLRLNSSIKYRYPNETVTVNEVYRFMCDLKKRKINDVNRGQPAQVRNISKIEEGNRPSKNGRLEIESRENIGQNADESADKGSGNTVMENVNEQKKDRTGQNGDNSPGKTAENDSKRQLSNEKEESQREKQKTDENGAKDAGIADGIVRAGTEAEGERPCLDTEKQLDDRLCKLTTRLDKAFYEIEQVKNNIEKDFRPKFEDAFNEKFKDAFEQGLVSTLPEKIGQHLSRYATQDSLSERLKAFDDLQYKLEEQKKRLNDQKKEIDSIQTEVLNRRVKELLEQFRNNVFKATINPLQEKIDNLSSVLEEKVSRKILEKTDEMIDSSLESVKVDLIWLSNEIPKIEDVRKSFSDFEKEIRQLVANPSMELEKERKIETLMSNIRLDPVVKKQGMNTSLTDCKDVFSRFESDFYKVLSEAAPPAIVGNTPEFKTFKEIARPVIDKFKAISQKMTVDGKKIIDQEIENKDVKDYNAFQDWFLNTEEAFGLFEQGPMPDMEAEYEKYLDTSVNDMWASYVAKRSEAFSSIYSDEQQYQADFDDLAEFIFTDFSKDGFEKIMEWQNQFPNEQRKTKEEIDEVRANLLDLCGIQEIVVKPCEDSFNPEIHSKQDVIKDSKYPNNLVIKALGKGYRVSRSGKVIRRAAVQVNLR